MNWGTNLTEIPDFYIDDQTLRIIQDYMFSHFHILLSGNPGCGKTEFGQVWAKVYGLPFHKVNCGAIRSPRDWFGRWEFREGKGTVFVPSKFIDMIEQPGLIILDEINRTTPDNHNPIMNILDGNREVYVEELNRMIKVHEQTLFLATRNTGRQHTGTFHLDHALEDRFQEIRLQLPSKEAIMELLQKRYPIAEEATRHIAGITLKLNEMFEGELLSKTMGLRPALAAAALLARGNNLKTALTFSFVYRYSADGGTDSEQTAVLQAIQGLVGYRVFA
ncbi:MAG TPA: MoxR family ATPase [Bacillota bacterium]|nr:MoxR family ATPase [Bacillota bacterium]